MKKNKQLITHVKYAILICFINTMAYAQCSLTSGPNATVINYECPQDILYITATIPYNGIYAQGRAFTKFGAGNGGQYKKPLIMVEGLDLDIGNNHDQGHRIGDRGWPNFIAGVSNEREPGDHILDNLPILINDLNSKGYDLIYFDHVDGANYMQANAMALVQLIQVINNLKVGNEPITIVGASMGGQIVKYALSYMEKNNIKHCVNEYISFDSPHQGANMPVSLQRFVNHFAPVTSLIATMRDKLNLPAAQQLLVLHSQGGYIAPSSLRTSWLADLTAVGTYPTKTRNVAIANGSGNATEIFAIESPIIDII